MKDLSIVIVSYNTKKLLSSCINSIIKKTQDLEYEIIVVDNASTDGSREYLKDLPESKKNINGILNSSNVGFSKANNQGLGKTNSRYVLFLNSDTLISDNVLAKMVDFMDRNPKVGVSTCKLVNKDGSVQATGGYFPTLPRVFAWMFFLDDLPLVGRAIKSFHPHTPDFFPNNLNYLRKHELDWVTGAFLFTKREILNKIGGWDESYFMYVEEVDLCYRIKKQGWEVLYLPESSIIHYGGASSQKEFPVLSEYEGLKKFYKKHYPSWQHFALRVLLKIGALLRVFVFGILEGRGRAKIYIKAFSYA